MLHVDWQLDWVYALTDTVLTNGLLLTTCLLVMTNLRFYNPKKGKFIHLLVMCVAVSGLWSAVIRFGLGAIFHGNESYSTFLERSMPVRFDIALLITSCAALISTLWYNQEEQKENEQRKLDAEKLAKEAELFKLRQQLQPHFLFNSLNSISALAGSQPQEARKMIQQLSDFLRGTLKKEDHQQISWKEELQYLNLYLEIEKVRFGHRLTTEINTSPETDTMQLPAMLLQPLVENAIKFGLYDTTEAITISIDAKREHNYLLVAVQNPFDEETSRPSQGTGFGLSSVQRRLYLLYGRNDLLTTSAVNNIFTTTIKIPQQ
jgi:LytS/YehU family sensor histidine kinase